MSVKITDNSAIFKAAKDRAVAAALAAIGEEAAGNAAEEIKNLDIVDTGRLGNSITYATQQHMEAKNFSWNKGKKSGAPAGSGTTAPKATPEKDAVYIGTNVEYARYIEAGTSKSAPRPFLKPAATGHGEEYKKIAGVCFKFPYLWKFLRRDYTLKELIKGFRNFTGRNDRKGSLLNSWLASRL